ncbi:MAG: hypothetical protein ACRELT_06705, partial [Longimicrobiales bacterium]
MTTHKAGGADHVVADAAAARGAGAGADARPRPHIPAADGPQPRAGDPQITARLVAEHGLSEEEYALIREELG